MSEKIGERIQIEKDKQQLRVEVSGKIKNWQESVLFAWVLMWTLCGLYVMVFFFQPLSFEEKMFLLVYLTFWAYFEYIAVRTWAWRKWGKEIIEISNGEMRLSSNLKTFGAPQKFFTQNVKNFGVVKKTTSFASVYFNSFWIIGGESIGFEYMGKKVAFGKQLSEQEAQKLSSLIRKYFKKK
jgi:hypothetical protein